MEIITIAVRNEQQKKDLLTFLDSRNYHYVIESDHELTDGDVKTMLNRKKDFYAGKTTSRSWNEIKNNYQ